MSDLDICNQHKNEGNTHFREKKFFDACRCYQSAISVCPETEKALLSIIYTNLSASQLQIEKTNEAFESAAKAIELDPTNAKAHYRHGLALSNSLDFKGAYNSYLAAAKLQPNEKFWRNLMDDAKKQLYKLKLREAMSSDDLKSAAKEAIQEPVDDTPIPEFNLEFARKIVADMWEDRRPSPAVTRAMLSKMKEMNKAMPNIVKLDIKGVIRVVGDTHGQYQDLRNIFAICGEPSEENPYLFNGDYVDRGSMGLEIVLALFAYKLANPQSIYMNRGNHETNMMNQMYGFEKECTQKYSKGMFDLFSDFFNSMPLGHVLSGRVLVVHGGLFSDQSVTVDSIQSMNRFGQPPESGPLNDILWSDPMEEKGFAPSPRGVTRTFGPDITEAFLSNNHLDLLIRSHQVQENGYGEMHNGKCITIFSAPNYIGQMGNKGAVVKLTFSEDGTQLIGKQFEQFNALESPKNYPPMKFALGGRFF